MAHLWRGRHPRVRRPAPRDRRDAGRHPRRGRHAAHPRASPLRAHRARGLGQVRGHEPDRVVQGPRHDDGDLAGGRARREGRHLRLHRQHLGSAAAYAAQAGITCARARARGQDRDGQAQPGDRARRQLLQVHGNFDDCLDIARELAEDYPVHLVNSVNPARIEGQKTAAFEVVEALGDAPDFHFLPVGNAGNYTAYSRGYREYRGDAERACPRVLRRRCSASRPRLGADRARPPRRGPRDHRHRDPHRQPGLVEARRPGPRRVRRPLRRDQRRADPARRTACSRREGVFVEPGSAAQRRRPAHGAEAGHVPPGPRVVCTVTGHGLKDPQWALRNAGRRRGRPDAGRRRRLLGRAGAGAAR